MQLGATPIDQFAFEGPGTITGEHVHLADVAATTIKDTNAEDNTIKFMTDHIEIAKGLTVLGPLNAPNIHPNGDHYPTDAAFETIHVTGVSQCGGGVVTNTVHATSVDTSTIKDTGCPVRMELETGGINFRDTNSNPLITIQEDSVAFSDLLDEYRSDEVLREFGGVLVVIGTGIEEGR